MNKEIAYIDYDEALTIYGKMIDASDGGFEGVRDEGGIRATLDFVQNDFYYPTFAEKLTYLMFRFCSGHFFNDGNKRIALTLGTYFLHKNKYYWHACICMRTLESIIYHVAASNIDQELLQRIVDSFMAGEDYDEALKLDIAKAMNNGALGIQGEDYE
jgi:death-on-curing protein